MRTIFQKLLIIGMIAATPAYCVGESAIITLQFPFGARSAGMGETGTALADDYSALYFNPAGLGVPNKSWCNGSAGSSFELLLPAFRIYDLWHLSNAAMLQLPPEFGGIGVFNNYINMGWNDITDNLGRPIKTVHSYEYVTALGWGFSLSPHTYLGISSKVFTSALAPGLGPHGEGTATSFAIDAGYLHILKNGLRFGLVLQNMGPSVYYINYIDRDPLPFTLNAAVAHTASYSNATGELVRYAMEFRVDKELVTKIRGNHPVPFYRALFIAPFDHHYQTELNECTYHFGLEWVILDLFAYRMGYLIDISGSRYEWHFGTGIHIADRITADFSYIHSPQYYLEHFSHQFDPHSDGATGARDGQWQVSLSADGLFGIASK